MDDNSTPEVVTEDEAIEKVKAWIAQMNWEKAQEGCKEILEIDPNNAEIMDLLAQAEKGIAERPAETTTPDQVVAQKAAEVAPKPSEVVTPTPSTPPPQQPTPAPAVQPTAPAAVPTQTPAPAPAPIPARKSKTTVIIAGIVFFLVVVLLILALVFGWPFRLIG